MVLYGTSSLHCQWQRLTASLRGTKTGSVLFPWVVGTGVLFHRRRGRWDSPLCGKTLTRLKDFLWRMGEFHREQQAFASVTAAKAMIQWLTSKPVKARPRKGGLQSLGLHVEWSQQSFCSWGGESVAELQLRRQTSQSCPGRESIDVSVIVMLLWGWGCSFV